MAGRDEDGAAATWGDRVWSVLFVVAGLGVSVFLIHQGVRGVRDWLVFDDFGEVTATVVRSESGLRKTGSSVRHGIVVDNERWQASVQFHYAWDGETLEGWADVPSEDSEAAARAAAAAHAPGTTVPVFVDPADPTHVYVADERPSLGGAIVFLVIGGFGVLLCTSWFIMPLVRRFRTG